MAKSRTEKVLDLVTAAGVLRPRDLVAHGIPRQYLTILVQRQLLRRTGRGLYVLANADLTAEHTFAEAAKRVPSGVICLLSALRMHGMTTQIPHEVWLAIRGKSRHPQADYPPLRIVRFSGQSFTERVQERRVEGVVVRLYDPAKTVADCFKYRNKIGMDVALEALRDCWRKRKTTMDDLWAAAKICRVERVMRPYLESLT
jgi:predicted transcriptional regulator of viral defense system